jgi:hypothetical protein
MTDAGTTSSTAGRVTTMIFLLLAPASQSDTAIVKAVGQRAMSGISRAP